MKSFFMLALLVLAASSAFAQLDTCSQGYEQWQQQQEEQQQMNPCREFLKQQCSTVRLPFVRSRMWQLSSCQVMRQQCCQQLRQMAPQSRCQAICTMVQAIMQQLQLQGEFGGSFYEPQQAQIQMMKMAQNLPSMCNVYPSYCSTPCSIATATTTTPGGCY